MEPQTREATLGAVAGVAILSQNRPDLPLEKFRGRL